MARPLKEGMDYFPHDTDAAGDDKLEALRALYGNDGYAFYFITLERVYRTNNGELDLSSPSLLAALIKKCGVTPRRFNRILETAFDIKAFNREKYEFEKVLTSNGIKKRFANVSSLRERWRNEKEESSNSAEGEEVFQPENPTENGIDNGEENPEETGESKVKKSIIKDQSNNNNAHAGRDKLFRPLKPLPEGVTPEEFLAAGEAAKHMSLEKYVNGEESKNMELSPDDAQAEPPPWEQGSSP